MSQCNELEQALKVADNPALGSTTERILAAEVRRLQAVNQTLNAIWEEVDTYARNHSEIQLGESVSQHALKLMRERDELKAELAELREQKPVAWMVKHNEAQQLELCMLKTEAESIGREMEETHFNWGEDGVRIPAIIIPLYAAPVPEQSQGKPAAPDAPDAGWRRFTDDDLAEIHQLAYELGGTDSGEYLLDGDQLDQVVVKCASLFYAFPVKSATAVPSGFAKKMCAYKPYLLSETHSGRYRIVIGFHSMEELHDCHASLVDLLQSAPTGEPK